MAASRRAAGAGRTYGATALFAASIITFTSTADDAFWNGPWVLAQQRSGTRSLAAIRHAHGRPEVDQPAGCRLQQESAAILASPRPQVLAYAVGKYHLQ